MQSQTGLSEDGYSVIEKNVICSMPLCHIKCTKPKCVNLCRHMYSCECYDYANGHICKHIHTVHIHNKASAHVETEIVDSGKHISTPSLSEKENILPGIHAVMFLKSANILYTIRYRSKFSAL